MMEWLLPLDQPRFNIILWVLITAYGASGVGNFIAFIPGFTSEEAEMLWYTSKSNNYSFRLISSLIFMLLWISQFRYPLLIYITIVEIYTIIIIYLCLIVNKWCYSKRNSEKRKQLKK